MGWERPVAARLKDGARLALRHGPIELIVEAEGAGRAAAFAAAETRFATVLEELVAELPSLRAALSPSTPRPVGVVAQRMHAAALPYAGERFVTRMAAVAGAVADEVLAAMRAGAAPLTRAFVNNGGDIALWLGPGQSFRVAMAGIAAEGGAGDLGRIALTAADGIGGVATSGVGGRSHSLGIADSVTVLARSAAAADVAATLIANAVDLPGHPGIARAPAVTLSPDSDLGERLVVTAVPPLTPGERATALQAGLAEAERFLARGLIAGAALTLQGETKALGGARAMVPLGGGRDTA